MKKKFVAGVLAVLMAASLTAGCGSKPENTADPAPSADKKTETEKKTEIKAETETKAETESETDVDESASEDFTLLDVSTDMIQAGVYAQSEEGTELVFSMFNDPSGTPMASLMIVAADGKTGDIICGTYEAESETDEDGIAWTLLTVADVYTDGEFEIGFGESDAGEVYIFDKDLTPYEGEYLTADETIDYMGVAVALMEQ